MPNPPSAAVAQSSATAPASMPVVSTWVEVSVNALRHNLRTIQAHVGPKVIVCPVIKSDAYGHGTLGCAKALRDGGAKWLAVSTAEEGIALRQQGIRERILVLSAFWQNEDKEIVRHRLTPAIWDRAQLDLLEKTAGAANVNLAIHLKVNTGMNRLGADTKDLSAIYGKIAAARHLSLEGIFSHFAASEVVGDGDGDEQLRRFDNACELAATAGLNPTIRHMANSAAIVTRPNSWFNLVRPGLAVYGYSLPLIAAGSVTSVGAPSRLPLQTALQWKTRVLQVRDVGAGQHVGYSAGHITKSQTRVAVLPVGYGDGLSRRLSSRGRVIIRGHYAPIIGNVSMNLTTVDVTAIPAVAIGDEVIVIGESGACRISAEEHATLAGTIPYEILCNISGRLPRIYTDTDTKR